MNCQFSLKNLFFGDSSHFCEVSSRVWKLRRNSQTISRQTVFGIFGVHG
ncbi:MAG: hypothetical protein LBU34_14045 [Planctomycetaceae bacterium]|nr:hypothetical protein [Planctomycetaceae bacterium]